MSEVKELEGWEDDYINTQVDRYDSNEGHGMIRIGLRATIQSVTRHWVMWLTFTKQVLAQLHLFRRPGWLWRRPGWASQWGARVC